MTRTDRDPPVTTVPAVVSVRIPDGSDTSLVTDAQCRINGVEGVRAVTVDGIEGVDPRLSATVVTVAVTIEGTAPVGELRDRLTDTACIETIDQLARTTA